MKTKFGLFSRGQKCEMCKQLVCHRCHTKVGRKAANLFELCSIVFSFRFFQMKIPLEHFNNTPVYALSPTKTPSAPQEVAGDASAELSNNQPQSLAPNFRDKKTSLPSSLGLLGTNVRSVGSAPSSPSADRKAAVPATEAKEPPSSPPVAVPTISAGMAAAEVEEEAAAASGWFGPVSLQPTSANASRIGKYATLPKK